MNAVKHGRWLRGIGAFAALLALRLSAQGPARDAIQADVDRLIEEWRFKENRDARIEPVLKHGTNAVPVLIGTYTRCGPSHRPLFVDCLCRLPTDESLGFLKEILRRREDQPATSAVVRHFPLDREDQITLLLVDLLTVRHQSLDARERLTKMIFRKPSRAGDLVKAMDLSDKSMVGRNLGIGGILASVSGYNNTWCCFGGSFDTDWGAWQRQFWTEWWRTNSNREPFEWLIETYWSDPNNPHRQEVVLQTLGSLRDPRSAALFVEALDSTSDRVRCWAVIGLKGLEGTLEPGGYRWETFQREQAQEIPRLKQKFSSHLDNHEGANPNAPKSGDQRLGSGTDRASSPTGPL